MPEARRAVGSVGAGTPAVAGVFVNVLVALDPTAAAATLVPQDLVVQIRAICGEAGVTATFAKNPLNVSPHPIELH